MKIANDIDVAIIGAGIAGLAAALRLAHAGRYVDVFEAHGEVGGKIRTIETAAGPADAGPTVLTMRDVFDDLFNDVGETLNDHIELIPQDKLARHFWSDGTVLDLFASVDKNVASIAQTFGTKAKEEYLRFHKNTKLLFQKFEAPMMRAKAPSQMHLNALVLRSPTLLKAMAPHMTLAKRLSSEFSDPKLAQLFGRYATYVGGAPDQSPAILALIWQAEAGGVWQAKNGMHTLAKTLRTLAELKGARFHINTPIDEISVSDRKVTGLVRANGTSHTARTIVFNGDPAALETGLMGSGPAKAVSRSTTQPRSHSANVWSFAAIPSRKDLCIHNVFFSDDPTGEFTDLGWGRVPTDPSLYVHAQDRGQSEAPKGAERFEIIMNAPPTTKGVDAAGDHERCKELTFSILAKMGLRFSPAPDATLTTPAMFGRLFPGSNGALYGRSPHGLMAAFKRPRARTKISGLYLAGGGCHPGAGVPMATLSGKHAAEAILSDQTSTSTSRQTDTHGGMSTVSHPTASPRSPSSVS